MVARLPEAGAVSYDAWKLATPPEYDEAPDPEERESVWQGPMWRDCGSCNFVKVLIGYFIRRSARDPYAFRGKTICAYPHTIYPTSRLAFDALTQARIDDALDPRFDYDVCEAWMAIDEDARTEVPR